MFSLAEQFTQAKELIDSSNRILLTMHERMDGDDGGSLLAMFEHLKKTGKQITCAIKKGVSPALAFLPHSEQIADDINHADFDLLIMFGCSVKSRCGSERIINLNIPTVNFDHHPDNTFFGNVNVVDSKKSSVAELLYDFFRFHKWPISKNIATCLLTGIITDTGSFMHSNTQDSTLTAAAELMRKGTHTSKIIRHTYKNKSLRVLNAWGKAMDNLYYDSKHKIIYSTMTGQDMAELEQLPPSAFEGFVETLNTFPEAKFAMFIKQDGEIIKGSLRSDTFKKTDVSRIARMFGGGGHKQAAGFSLAGKLVKNPSGAWEII